MRLLVACLALTSCAAARQDSPRMYADYECGATKTLVAGEIHVVRWLSSAGALSSTVVVWTPRMPSGLLVTGGWQANPPAPVDFSRGLAMFDQTVGSSAKRGTPHYRLELRARAEPPWDGTGFLEGRFAMSDTVRLSADWADVAAMARGAGRLFLVVKDRKGAMLSAQAIDRSAFEGFESAAAKLLTETADMVANYRTRCESIRTGDIII